MTRLAGRCPVAAKVRVRMARDSRPLCSVKASISFDCFYCTTLGWQVGRVDCNIRRLNKTHKKLKIYVDVEKPTRPAQKNQLHLHDPRRRLCSGLNLLQIPTGHYLEDWEKQKPRYASQHFRGCLGRRGILNLVWLFVSRCRLLLQGCYPDHLHIAFVAGPEECSASIPAQAVQTWMAIVSVGDGVKPGLNLNWNIPSLLAVDTTKLKGLLEDLFPGVECKINVVHERLGEGLLLTFVHLIVSAASMAFIPDPCFLDVHSATTTEEEKPLNHPSTPTATMTASDELFNGVVKATRTCPEQAEFWIANVFMTFRRNILTRKSIDSPRPTGSPMAPGAFPRLSSKLKFSLSAISREQATMDGVIVICKVSIDEATESLENYQDRIGRQRKYLVMQESRPLARTMRWSQASGGEAAVGYGAVGWPGPRTRWLIWRIRRTWRAVVSCSRSEVSNRFKGTLCPSARELPTHSRYEDCNRRIKDWGLKSRLAPGVVSRLASRDHKKADKRLERLGGHGLNQAMACARLSNCIREQSAAQMEQITGRTVEKTVPTELVPHRLKVHIWMAGGGARQKSKGCTGKPPDQHEISAFARDQNWQIQDDLGSPGESTVETREGANDTDMVLVQLETPIGAALGTIARANEAFVGVVLSLTPKPALYKDMPDDLFNVDSSHHERRNCQRHQGRQGRQGRNRAGSLQSNQPECDQRCRTEYMDECWSFAAKGARVVVINPGSPGRSGAQDEEEERQDFIGAYVVELLRQRRSGEEENINAAINVGVKSGGLSIWDQLEIHDDFEWISDM
ncbi:hypothetical protein PoMZ_00088 [Pyricularia oryzae]|nr:hypothetical protein PoMZ_00088 [Pyricularia oryzae]